MPTPAEARAELARRELSRRAAARVRDSGGDMAAQGQAAAQAYRAASGSPPRPSAPPRRTRPNAADDVRRSGESGIARGFAGLAELGNPIMAQQFRQAGVVGTPMQALEAMGLYQPQTTAGEYARSIGENAPGAIMPGGIVQRSAQAILPGVASETAGQGARAAGMGAEGEGWARFIGSLVGGAGAGFIPERAPAAASRPGPPRLPRAERAAVRRVAKGVDPAEARRVVAEIREFGGEPVLADAIGSRGQARIRAAATRDIPEQQTAIDFADSRRVGTQSYTSRLGERVSPETRSPAAAQEAIAQARSNQAAIDYGPLSAEPVPVTPEVLSALADDYGRAAVARARTDAIANREYAFADELASLDSANPPAVVSAKALDAIRRAMGGRGARLNQNPNTANTARGLFGRAGDIDGALENVTALKPARTNFREAIGEEEAVVAGGRLMAPKGIRADLEAAAAMTDAQRQAALGGARNAIEEGAGTPARAATTLDTLAFGQDAGSRLRAWGGASLADDVQRGAQRGRQMLETGRRVSPRTGSETNLNAENSKALNTVGAAIETGAAVSTGGLSTIARPLAAAFKGFGLSDADAGRMVQIALSRDPQRLEAALLQIERTNAPAAARIRSALATPQAQRALAAGAISLAAPGSAQARPGPPR